MEEGSPLNKKSLFTKWQEIRKRDASVMADTLRINVNRQYYLSLIAIPVSVVHIVYFYFFLTTTTFVEEQWRIGIVSAHTVLLVVSSVVLILANRYRKKAELPKWMRLFPTLQMVLFLFIGAVISSIDQLVTPNITPFLIATVIAGIVFLTPLMQVIIVYVFGYSVFFFALSLTQTSEAILASNRVNGLTMIGIGIGLAYVLWKAHCTAVFQRRFIQQQNEDLEKKNKELYQLASIDLLTGLYTRRHFEEIMKEQISILKINQASLSVIVMDIDHFKRINDQWGHPVGDVVLQGVSRCLLKEKRKNVIVARWGGEEFLIALFSATLAEAEATAEAFRQALESTPIIVDEHSIAVTASFGIAQVNEVEDFRSFELAFRHADQALYEAKQSGRNCVKVFA